MKKIGDRELILIIIGVLVIIALVYIGLKLTGYVVSEIDVSVYRLVDGNNVKLSIVSSENVLAIQENFSSEECKVVNYLIEPEIEIFVFKETENTWILANRSNNLIAELSYRFGSDNNTDCSVVSGQYFIVSGEALGGGPLGEGTSNETQEENETQETPAISTPGGGGGSGGGGGGGGISSGSVAKPEMLSDKIIDVKDEKELEGAVEIAIRKISGEETPGEIKKGPVVLTGILLLIVISIIIFLVVSFSRKPNK